MFIFHKYLSKEKSGWDNQQCDLTDTIFFVPPFIEISIKYIRFKERKMAQKTAKRLQNLNDKTNKSKLREPKRNRK